MAPSDARGIAALGVRDGRSQKEDAWWRNASVPERLAPCKADGSLALPCGRLEPLGAGLCYDVFDEIVRKFDIQETQVEIGTELTRSTCRATHVMLLCFDTTCSRTWHLPHQLFRDRGQPKRHLLHLTSCRL